MPKLWEIKRDIERIGQDWDGDMYEQGKVIDIENILRDIVEYMIAQEQAEVISDRERKY